MLSLWVINPANSVQVGVADWQTLNWVCQKFRRITMPYLWRNTSVDFARRTGHSFSAQALGEMKVGLESGINFATQYNMAIVTNVIHHTIGLTLFVSGDRAFNSKEDGLPYFGAQPSKEYQDSSNEEHVVAFAY